MNRDPLYDILIDEYFFAFVFCREQHLPPAASSAFLSILKEVIQADINMINQPLELDGDGPVTIGDACDHKSIAATLGPSTPQARQLATSFSRCKALFLQHSIDCYHTSCVRAFTQSQVEQCLEYFRDNYYRHFKLFRYNFTKQRRVDLITKCEL